MPNSDNDLARLIYPWGAPWPLSSLIPSLITFFIFFQSLNPSATPRLRHQETTAPLNPWLSIPLDLLIWLFSLCRFSKTSILSVFFFLLICHLFAVSFSFSAQQEFMLYNISLQLESSTPFLHHSSASSVWQNLDYVPWIQLSALAISVPGLLDIAGNKPHSHAD